MKHIGSRSRRLVWPGSTILLLALVARAGAQPVNYAGHKLIRVETKSFDDVNTLESLGALLLDCHIKRGSVNVSLAPDGIAALNATGLPYTILDHDIGPDLAPGPRGGGPFDAYMPFEDIVAFINSLAAARPDLCEVIDIGNSLEGRDIWVLHITGPSPGPKPAVFYHGLQHAREWITGPMVMYLADHLVNNYDSDPCIADLVNRMDIYLAPCVNPDGYVYTWGPNRLWRKNRRNNGGSFGVDLNRNWAYQWGYSDSGSSPNGSSETYRGTGPFSEPETQVLSNFIAAHPEIRAYMDYHSFSQLILWPFGYDCFEAPEPDASTFAALGFEMQRLIQEVHGLTYTAGPICQTLYDANGSSVDWVYAAADRLAFTIELRPGPNDGAAFQLPPEQIIPTCQENLPAILHLTRTAADGITLSFPAGAPTEVSAGAATALTIDITEAYEPYAPGSATLYYRFAPTAPYSTASFTPLGGGSYQALVPAAPCGATVEYYVVAQTVGGTEVRRPCDAPANTFTAVSVGQPVVLVADDLEGPTTGWTVGDTGDNATTGVWVRVDPNGTAAQPADDHTPGAATTCFVTGQGLPGGGLGDNDVDMGKTTLKTPVFDLSADTDASIGYWRWYSNTTGGAPGADVFIVDISNDGGSTWTPLEQVGPTGPQTGGGWFYAEFQVAAFVTPTAQVRLRFVAADAGAGSIIEAAIDDFRVTRTVCNALPGDADGDGDVDLGDYAYFVDCLGGPGAAVPVTCQAPHEVFDVDNDTDIDLEDFQAFQTASGAP